VATRHHPVHYASALHGNADLLFKDIEYHARWYKRLTNHALRSAYEWFKYHFDIEYQETVYSLIVEKINTILKDKKTITVVTPLCSLDIQDSLKIKCIDNSGPNHMSINANVDFYKELIIKIDEFKQS